jgi:hypothetical protein
MTITKRPPAKKAPSSATVEKFIASAPDAKPPETPRKGVMRGKREQISHTITPELLQAVDELAPRLSLTRAGLINSAIAEFVKARGQ